MSASNTEWARRLGADIAAYNAMREKLETDCFGKYVIIHDGKLVGAYDSSQDAFSYGFHEFGAADFLMRQVGAPTDKMLKQELIEYKDA